MSMPNNIYILKHVTPSPLVTNRERRAIRIGFLAPILLLYFTYSAALS